MARVFISYAGEDLASAREVRRWLVETRHEVFLDQDPQDGIPVGEPWRQRLLERLRWADAVVCVVTSASVASSWCTAEVVTAQSRGSRLLPLRAEPEVDHPLLADIQHTDLAQDPEAARVALLATLRRIDAAGGSGWPDDRSPFPGLRPFEVDQHRVFFGRAEEIKALVEQVRATSEAAALLVVGPSGCGKSSLVRAGLVPVLAGEPGWRILPPILPGADPVTALARELAAAARRTGLDWTMEHVQQRLDTTGFAALADELLLADPDGPQRRLLVVVDQFEELLTHTPPGQRARFAALLRPALSGPVRVVGTLRPEFLDQLLLDPTLATLPAHPHTLRPLRREALRAVIEEPARLAGIDLDDGLADRLVDDTDSGEALPLLAFTLAQLADGVSRGGRLSTARYDQLGGVQGALTRQAGAALAEAIASGRSRDQVIAGLLRLVTVDEQGRPTRWRVDRADLPTPVITELDAFVTRRLLTTDSDNDTVLIGVAHEAFLSAWPPLAQAITQNVSALRARRAVEHAATAWHDHARPPTRLWTGGQLAAAVTDTGARLRTGPAPPDAPPAGRPWLPGRRRVLVTDRVTLSPTARDFLHASIRHDRHRRRRTTTVLSALLILALTAAGLAIVQQNRAQEQTRIATARLLMAQADSARPTDLRAAARLGLAAHRLHPDGETQANLVTTLTSSPYYANTLTGHTGPVRSVAFAPDGNSLATAADDNTVILWDTTERSAPRRLGTPLTGHTGRVLSVAFAPDGNILATASYDSTVMLWDLTDRSAPHLLGTPLTGHTGPVSSVAFARDARTLATAGVDRTVILWDITDRAAPGRLRTPLTGHTAPVFSVAFAPDGNTLATADDRGTVILWELTEPTRARRIGNPLPNHTSSVFSVTFAPDGNTLATADNDRNVILWDITDRSAPRRLGNPLTDYTDLVFSVAFAPDGNTLATASYNNTVILWDLTDQAAPRRLGAPLTGHTSAVFSVAFAPDGHTLASASDDRTVILWDLTDRTRPHQLDGSLDHTSAVSSAAVAPDGHTLASGGEDGTVSLWDITDPTRHHRFGAPLTGHTSPVRSVAFAPDGDTLATAGNDNAVILWDLTDRTQPHQLGAPLTGHTNPVNSVAFAPDGDTLASGGYDNTVILWDLTDPTTPHQLGAPLSHTSTVFSVAFAPDGDTLATAGSDGAVMLWDLTDPTQPHQLDAPLSHTSAVNSVAFTPDGNTLATAGNDRTVMLWDLTDRTTPRRLSDPLAGHSSQVRSVAFAPNGSTLATAGNDGTVILWDLTDRTQPHQLGTPLTGHTRAVRSVAFTPDGRLLATASEDRTVILWDLAGLNDFLAHVVERACAIAPGGLGRNEWAALLTPAGLPYQETCPA